MSLEPGCACDPKLNLRRDSHTTGLDVAITFHEVVGLPSYSRWFVGDHLTKLGTGWLVQP